MRPFALTQALAQTLRAAAPCGAPAPVHASGAQDRVQPRRPVAPASTDGVEIVPVASDVYMLATSASNVTVNVGPQGLLVVDAGPESMSANPDHVGGAAALNQLAQAIRSRETIDTGAVILAHENTFNRMSAPTGDQAPTPLSAWANSTLFVQEQDEQFNGQAVQLVHRATTTGVAQEGRAGGPGGCTSRGRTTRRSSLRRARGGTFGDRKSVV